LQFRNVIGSKASGLEQASLKARMFIGISSGKRLDVAAYLPEIVPQNASPTPMLNVCPFLPCAMSARRFT
jgi:hypothetical protein